jgi:hypothetical protein
MKRNYIARRAASIAACVVAMAVANGTAASAIAQEAATRAAPNAVPAESSEELVNAPGRERVAHCGACHSLDYIRMNSRFLNLAGWTGVVNKMINVYGAPIEKTDVDTIARYLTEHYGQP